MQNNRSRHGGQPQQQPERTQVHRANIDIGIHSPRFPSSVSPDRGSKTALRSGKTWPAASLRANLGLMPTSTTHAPTAFFPSPETMEILIPKEKIAQRTREIGAQISAEYEGQSIVLIGVLKGAAIFLADLARAIKVDNTFDFVAVSSYGRARVSSGAVKLIKDIDNPIEGRHVILVEDILDTGLTLNYPARPDAATQARIAEDRHLPRQARSPPRPHRSRLRRLQDSQSVRRRLRHGLCRALPRSRRHPSLS